VCLPKIALGTDKTAMNFRRLLPEIRWQSRLSPVPCLRVPAGRPRGALSTLAPVYFWGMMTLERSCKAGAGLSILIQHLKIGSPTRFGAGEQASGGLPQGRSLKALGGHPPRFTNVGQCRGPARPSGALPFPGSPPLCQVGPGDQQLCGTGAVYGVLTIVTIFG